MANLKLSQEMSVNGNFSTLSQRHNKAGTASSEGNLAAVQSEKSLKIVYFHKSLALTLSIRCLTETYIIPKNTTMIFTNTGEPLVFFRQT